MTLPLQEMAQKRSTNKADAFTLGRLTEAERSRAAGTLDGLPDAWRCATPLAGIRP